VYKRQGKNIFIKDEVYKTQLTNSEFLKMCVAKCKEHNILPKDLDLWGDPSEPARMLEFEEEGFNILPGVKEPLTRIDVVKRMPVWVADNCVNTWRESKSFKWMTDKDGDILDRPVKFNDHSMDAIGYGVVGMMELLGRAVPTDPYLIVGGGPSYY
jgi:phage terminase large subunit